MIVIRIELWPGGQYHQRTHLGTAVIANDGTGTPTRGNYTARFASKGRGYPKIPDLVRGISNWKTSRVVDFPRQKLNAWDLLLLALLEAIGDRNLKAEYAAIAQHALAAAEADQ